MKRTLIIISGPSASGKTTFARKLSAKLNTPWIGKDMIKESLFDSLGYWDRAWSVKLDKASYQIMQNMAIEYLKHDLPVILESDFERTSFGKQYQAIIEQCNPRVVQVLFRAEPKTLFARFKKRVENKQRHPGHVDGQILSMIKSKLLRNLDYRLDSKATTINIDSSDFAQLDSEHYLEKITKLVA